MVPRDSINFDWLHKIRPVLDKIVNNFKTHYTPQQNLSVDESMGEAIMDSVHAQEAKEMGHKNMGTGRWNQWVCQ